MLHCALRAGTSQPAGSVVPAATRARWQRALAVRLLVAALALVALAAQPATPRSGSPAADVGTTTALELSAHRSSTRVVLRRPQTLGARLRFRGRASAPRVRLQRRDPAGWVTVGRSRTSSAGRFVVRTERLAVRRTYRAVAAGTRSRTWRVAPARAPRPASRPATEPTTEPTDTCGPPLAKADGTAWTCTLADEFDGTALDRDIWTVMQQSDHHGGTCMVDDPRTHQVADGMLRLTVRPTTDDLRCPVRADGTRASFASAAVSTWQKWSQQYGRFEARMAVADASAPGLQEAFWLWPDDRVPSDELWPAAGEIDIVETYSQYPTLAIPFLHYGAYDNGGPIPGLNTAWHCVASRGAFHTYVLEWTPELLRISIDGRTCLTNTVGADSFDKPFIMTLSQMLGVAGNAHTGAVDLPATLQVDHVKVWR